MTARTPPQVDLATQRAEDDLKTRYRDWRRTLHRAKDYRVKVLRALSEDGNVEAAELLHDPPRAYKAVWCKLCAGCLLMGTKKACGSCQGCMLGRGCEEHHRRCLQWPRNANTYHGGSEITAISSQFDLLSADLSKYEAVISRLQEIDLEMEEAVDALPQHSDSKTNLRFLQSARDKDLDDERLHVSKLGAMLQKHVELASRLTELDDEVEGDPPGEPLEPALEPPLTATQTSRDLIEMFRTAGAIPREGDGSLYDLE